MNTSAKRLPETISEAEIRIESTLETLRNLPLNDEIQVGLSFLTRPGYRTVVQLEEDGRKKRSSAAISNWTPDTGEVVIFFERLSETETPQSVISTQGSAGLRSGTQDVEISSAQVQECCDALADAEKAGKAFIALKWFRDEALANSSFGWAQNAEERQRVLATAIEEGRVRTNRIPNPKNPQFPTTTVSLNRTSIPATVRSRFNPVPIKGEPASATLLRDRGSY